MGAGYHRGSSTQDVQTPPDFIWRVEDRYNIDPCFQLDAAASDDNHIPCIQWYTEEMDGLVLPWQSWTWCNPPYSNIRPWVEKAANEFADRDVQSMLLVPASVGSNWWHDYVHDLAHVVFLNGRLTFVGHNTPYPKDLALLIYSNYSRGGYEIWSWQ